MPGRPFSAALVLLVAACTGAPAPLPPDPAPEVAADPLAGSGWTFATGPIDWSRAEDGGDAEADAAEVALGAPVGGAAPASPGFAGPSDGVPPGSGGRIAESLASLGYGGGGGGAAPRAENSEGGSPPLLSSVVYEVVSDFERTPSEGAAPVETWRRATAAPNSARIRVGDDAFLPLEAAQASVRVDGFRARVVLDLFFRNDRAQELEGSFQLRLPEGASVDYLAFGGVLWTGPRPPAPDDLFLRPGEDGLQLAAERLRDERDTLWLGVKEARIVPREAAAYAYQDTVRQQVDPALLEWSGAGVFSARVFPLRMHTLHRVVVAYELDLVRAGDDWELAFALPDGVPDRALELEVRAPAGVRALLDGRELSLPRAPESRRGDAAAGFALRLVAPGPLLLATPHGADGGYFAADLRPELPAVAAAGGDRAVLLLDTSLSSAGDRLPVQLDLLDAVLARNEGSLRRFAVCAFDVGARWYRGGGFLENTPFERAALRAWAEGLPLEGATDLGLALRQAAAPAFARGARPDWDVFLLSDGASTWGEAELAATLERYRAAGGGPVFAYRTGLAGTAVDALERVARGTGGALFSVAGAAEVAGAAVAHRSRPWRLLGVRVEGGDDVLVAGDPRSVYPGQALRLVGRGRPAAGARATLELAQDGVPRTVEVWLARALESELAERAFGVVAVERLEALGRGAEREARALATRFRVPRETCSLLMLESEADYARYAIDPAADAELAEGLAVAATAERLAEQLGHLLVDPRARLFAQVDRLAGVPELAFALPADLGARIAALPDAALELAPEPLDGLPRRAPPAAYAAALAAEDGLYDALREEVARRRADGDAGSALRALSSLVERFPGDAVAARDVAYTALELGFPAHAHHLLWRVAQARPFEPVNYLALARAAADAGRPELALVWHEIAGASPWSGRHGDLARIVAVEELHLLRGLAPGALDPAFAAWAEARRPELAARAGLDRADLLVVLFWNTDRTDVDLHVREPSGEVCYFGNSRTASGGGMTSDVTQGFGPELYALPSAPSGEYAIGAHYFGSDPLRSGVRTQAYATLYVGWGTPGERRLDRTVELVAQGTMHDVGTLGARE